MQIVAAWRREKVARVQNWYLDQAAPDYNLVGRLIDEVMPSSQQACVLGGLLCCPISYSKDWTSHPPQFHCHFAVHIFEKNNSPTSPEDLWPSFESPSHEHVRMLQSRRPILPRRHSNTAREWYRMISDDWRLSKDGLICYHYPGPGLSIGGTFSGPKCNIE